MGAKMEPGTYDAKVIAATISEYPSGAVMCRMELDIGLTGSICLVQKDGTLSERGFKDVQAIFGLTGTWDWALWERDPAEWAGAAVEVVVETVQGEKGEFSSVKYVNVPGGGASKIEKADAKSLAAKYGAKTRALFGGAPSAPKPPAARPAPPKAPPPPAAPVKTSTMEACWDAFCKLHEGKGELELYALWPKQIATATDGKEQNNLTPADWGDVLFSITQF
jgi:hypothetical protein